MKADTPVDSKGAAIEKILNKYVSNYDLEVLGFRQSGQQTVIREILAILAQEVNRVIGEDEPNNYHGASYRNQLRAEQRRKAGLV